MRMSPSASSHPEERLLKPWMQFMSLLSALLAAIISLWSLRDPGACVSFTEKQAYAPKQCKALQGYADANTHLLGFCYMNCGDTEVRIYAWSLLFGMLLQSLTVLPSHCNCGMFLRVTWRVDFTGDLAELEELTNQRSGGWLWRRIQAWTGEQRGNLFDWLEKLLQKQSKMLPLHMAAIHKLSMFWLLIALLELLLHAASSVQLYQGSVSFQCPSIAEQTLEIQADVKYGAVEVSGQLLTILLLFFSIFLSSRAQWRICLEVTAGELRQLLGPQGGHGGGVVVPKTRHPVLSRVFGKELTELRGPRRPLPVEQPKMWGEDSEVLHAHFGNVKERSTPQVRQRGYLSSLAALGAVLLFNASSSCWGCINEISLGASGGLFDVEAQLLLLGSCGRHNGSGIPCLLGAFCLVILILAQLVILAAGVTGVSEKLQDDDQMAITLVDFREYQENLIHSLYAGQKVRSHVWLRPYGEAWQVANFSEAGGLRSKWRRSQSVVSGVRIVETPDEQWDQVHSRGLPTDEGPSTVYVEFDTPDDETEISKDVAKVRQMVPVDFLPGAFFCSVSVGRQDAWNNLSMMASCSALALVVFDLTFHLQYSIQGTLLKDCEDILSGRCLELEPRDQRRVASAIGVYLALLGGVCIILVIGFLIPLRREKLCQSFG